MEVHTLREKERRRRRRLLHTPLFSIDLTLFLVFSSLSLSLSSRRRPHTQELTGLGGTMSAFSLSSSCVAFRLWPRCFLSSQNPSSRWLRLCERPRPSVLSAIRPGYGSPPGAGRCLLDVRREFGNGMRSDEAGNGEILEGVNHPLRFFGVLKLSD